jgi:hypothetical protein
MVQSGHNDKAFNYKMIQADYQRTPPKPVLDSEPCYEYIPIDFKSERGRINAYEVRRAAYWAVFSGAFGHTYGANPIWQMYDEGRNPIIEPDLYWHEALDLPGAFQMKYVKDLLLSRDMLASIPDQSLIAGEVDQTRRHIAATRGKDYAFLYCPMNEAVKVKLGKIRGDQVKAWWYNPRNGIATAIGLFDNTGTLTLSVPPDGPDWILVLDDAQAAYPPPGQMQ